MVKRNIRKVLSLFILLLVLMVPAAAFADDTEPVQDGEDSVQAVYDGEEVSAEAERETTEGGSINPPRVQRVLN